METDREKEREREHGRGENKAIKKASCTEARKDETDRTSTGTNQRKDGKNKEEKERVLGGVCVDDYSMARHREL